MSILLRAAPSGPVTNPVPGIKRIGYTGSTTLVLTLAPIGHRAGIYTVGAEMFVRTIAGAGNFATSVLSWNEPLLGATTLAFAPGAPTVLGVRINVLRSLPSTGLAPITYTIIPTGITGSPIIDVIAYAELAAEYARV